ncbi:hypothetical protein ACFV9C_42020 [Kribbella sp. NPDC059898]|uniref:hypothetical protein n=1 Tax=Kribbella sp. NPDC059898 TaxID=3346995 RepID=UPI00364BAF75
MPDVLYALLVQLIRDQGGSVTVRVPDLLDQVTNATWLITGNRGPGPVDTTWTVERTFDPSHN